MSLKKMIRNVRRQNGYADPKEETVRPLDLVLVDVPTARKSRASSARALELMKKDHGA